MTDTQADEGPVNIDISEILKRLPHRYPFLLVDRAEDYRANESIIGIKCVTHNEPFFPGHFPENPVMPGVLIIEAIAQSGALLMSKTLNADATGRTIMIITVDNARFRAPVKPGDVLRMHVDVVKHRGDLFKFSGRGMVNDKLVAQCDFAAMVVDNPK